MSKQIVGLLRVKDGEKYIERMFLQLSKICNGGLIVLDDNSRDNTYTLCLKFGQLFKDKFKIFQSVGTTFDGGRDRIFLHNQIKELDWKCDWVYSPDIDEFIEEGCEQDVISLVERANKIEAFAFPFLFMWNNEGFYRVDKKYSNLIALKLYKYNPNEVPENVKNHSTPVPKAILDRRRWMTCKIRMLHLGYMSEKDRQEKYEWYMNRDKQVLQEDSSYKKAVGSDDYSHIIDKEVTVEEWCDSETFFGNKKFFHNHKFIKNKIFTFC